MSNNKYIALPGSLTCKRVTTVTFPHHTNSDNPTFQLTEVMPEGEVFSGETILRVQRYRGGEYSDIKENETVGELLHFGWEVKEFVKPLKDIEPVSYSVSPELAKQWDQEKLKLFNPLVDIVENKEERIEDVAKQYERRLKYEYSPSEHFIEGANWQQSQSIEGIVGFVLECLSKRGVDIGPQRADYIAKITEEYNNGK